MKRITLEPAPPKCISPKPKRAGQTLISLKKLKKRPRTNGIPEFTGTELQKRLKKLLAEKNPKKHAKLFDQLIQRWYGKPFDEVRAGEYSPYIKAPWWPGIEIRMQKFPITRVRTIR